MLKTTTVAVPLPISSSGLPRRLWPISHHQRSSKELPKKLSKVIVIFFSIFIHFCSEACKDKQLCVFAFLPHILDCQSKCRNDYIAVLKESAEKFKKNAWGWIWVEGGSQPALEEAFGVGGFGYPAMSALNARKMKFAMLKGSFGKDGIHEFLRDLSYGKGQTASVKVIFSAFYNSF